MPLNFTIERKWNAQYSFDDHHRHNSNTKLKPNYNAILLSSDRSPAGGIRRATFCGAGSLDGLPAGSDDDDDAGARPPQQHRRNREHGFKHQPPPFFFFVFFSCVTTTLWWSV